MINTFNNFKDCNKDKGKTTTIFHLHREIIFVLWLVNINYVNSKLRGKKRMILRHQLFVNKNVVIGLFGSKVNQFNTILYQIYQKDNKMK